MNVQIQAFSDAIIRFSSNPDGSGSNFEVKIGDNGNMQTCIYENDVRGICTATPGILSPIEFRSLEINWFNEMVYVLMDGSTLMPPHMLVTSFKVRFVGVGTR